MVLALVARTGWFVHKYLTVVVPDSYAVWWVADLVVDYMEHHENRWPSGWDDLLEPYERLAEKSGRPWTFEELQERVDVDWDADPRELARAPARHGAAPFRAIWLKDGGEWYWGAHEPNDIVWSYLKARPADSAASPK